MRKLLNIELVKLLNNNSVRVILGLHLLLFLLLIFVFSQINITVTGFDTANLLRFPHIWGLFTWIASWFNLLLAILIIMVTGNEFSYRTFRQHVIDGLGRIELLKGKLLVIFIIALYSFFLVLISGMIYGFIYSKGLSFRLLFTDIDILLVYFLQAVAYMLAGFMLVMLIRTTALSIILFILLRFPIEPVIRTFFDPSVRPFFPMKAIGGLTPMPEFLSISAEDTYDTVEGSNALNLGEMGLLAPTLPLYIQILLTTGYIILFIFIIAGLLIKRDI